MTWYSIRSQGSGPATVYLYGTIGADIFGDGTPAIDFARELEALGSRPVDLRVNSEGGDVFEGYAIYSAIKRYPGRVTAYVDGLAASAASFLILAADDVVMGETSCLFVHKAWTVTVGNSGDHREALQRLETLDEQLVGIYTAHSNQTAGTWRKTLAETRLFAAEEAVAWGLASRIDGSLKAAASISATTARRLFGDRVPEPLRVVDNPTRTTRRLVLLESGPAYV